MDLSKTTDSKKSVVRLKFFSVITDKPEKFLEQLDRLCKEYFKPKDFFFRYSIEN